MHTPRNLCSFSPHCVFLLQSPLIGCIIYYFIEKRKKKKRKVKILLFYKNKYKAVYSLSGFAFRITL